MTWLVIDIGSSSVRALLFGDEAALVPGGVAKRSYTLNTQPRGASSADPEHVRSLVEDCIDTVLLHPAARHVQAVGMATLVGNLVGVNALGAAVTPLYTYADTRSAGDVKLLSTLVDPQVVHQRTGCPLHSAYHPARLHWLRRTQPDRISEVATWLDLGTYLYQQWFARQVPCSYSVASWSGLLNRNRLAWDAPWLKLLGISKSVLSPLADYTAVQTALCSAYAQRWPALRAVPFFLAVGDGAAANVGSGATDSGQIALTVGTTAALRMMSDKRPGRIPDGLWAYRLGARQHLVGGATSEGGNVLQWVQQTLRLPGATELQRKLEGRAPKCHGLLFLPLLAGERSPGWAPDATGVITGLRLSTTPLDVAQAALEGVALRLSAIARQLRLDPNATVMASGGALAHSRVWAQMISNAFNRPIHLLDEPEVTGRGTAILVMGTLKQAPRPRVSCVLEPNAGHAAIMQEMGEQLAFLYQSHVAAEKPT